MQTWPHLLSIASVFMNGVIEQNVFSGLHPFMIEVTRIRVHHLCDKSMGRFQPLLSGIAHQRYFLIRETDDVGVVLGIFQMELFLIPIYRLYDRHLVSHISVGIKEWDILSQDTSLPLVLTLMLQIFHISFAASSVVITRKGCLVLDLYVHGLLL